MPYIIRNRKMELMWLKNLIKDNRVNFDCPANYEENNRLDNIVKTIIDKVKAVETLQRM